MSYSRFEIKLASLLIGVIDLMLAFVMVFGTELDPVHAVLAARGRADDFGLALAILGLMTAYGSVRPKRACRQIGLALSSMMLLVVFGALLTGHWLTLTHLILVLLAVAALLLLGADVRGKPNGA